MIFRVIVMVIVAVVMRMHGGRDKHGGKNCEHEGLEEGHEQLEEAQQESAQNGCRSNADMMEHGDLGCHQNECQQNAQGDVAAEHIGEKTQRENSDPQEDTEELNHIE